MEHHFPEFPERAQPCEVYPKFEKPLTRVASVSVGSGSKERPRNGIFVILPAPCKCLLPNCTETLATQAKKSLAGDFLPIDFSLGISEFSDQWFVFRKLTNFSIL